MVLNWFNSCFLIKQETKTSGLKTIIFLDKSSMLRFFLFSNNNSLISAIILWRILKFKHEFLKILYLKIHLIKFFNRYRLRLIWSTKLIIFLKFLDAQVWRIRNIVEKMDKLSIFFIILHMKNIKDLKMVV